jgi:hypothetical protein
MDRSLDFPIFFFGTAIMSTAADSLDFGFLLFFILYLHFFTTATLEIVQIKLLRGHRLYLSNVLLLEVEFSIFIIFGLPPPLYGIFL